MKDINDVRNRLSDCSSKINTVLSDNHDFLTDSSKRFVGDLLAMIKNMLEAIDVSTCPTYKDVPIRSRFLGSVEDIEFVVHMLYTRFNQQ